MNTQIDNIARVLKVLGEPNRLGIVFAIGKGSRAVTEIIKLTGLSQTLVSFHLRVLREADIVVTRRDGPFIFYSLKNPELIDILNVLHSIAQSRETGETSSPLLVSVEMAGKGGK
ncbi:MAG: winged helix-turn-helix transcriptional regulator [Nitrospirae bacterium]|nr:winged helix-turn-helix transcriptional regulator [Nitrospirota bacterium]